MSMFTCPIETCSMPINMLTYRTHAAWHDNRRPYRCDLCKLAYGDNSSLIVHQRTREHRKNENQQKN